MGAEVVAITLGSLAMCFGAYGIAGVWQHWKQRPADPRAILAERFARGEIDDAEYQRRLAILIYGPPLPLDLPEPSLERRLPVAEVPARLEAEEA